MIPEYATVKARREARQDVRFSGRFEGESPITVILNDISVERVFLSRRDGHKADSGLTGEASIMGEWVQRIGRRILYCSEQGFLTSERFESVEAAEAHFETVREAIDPATEA